MMFDGRRSTCVHWIRYIIDNIHYALYSAIERVHKQLFIRRLRKRVAKRTQSDLRFGQFLKLYSEERKCYLFY